MRRIAAFLLTSSIVTLGLTDPTSARARPVESPDLAGSWKLVLMPSTEIDLAIVDLKPTGGKLAATVISANQGLLGPVKTAEGTIAGDRVMLEFAGLGDSTIFRGVVDRDGKQGKGSFKFRGGNFPGRIERTREKTVAVATQPPPMARKIAEAQKIKEPKEQVVRLRELIAENAGHPMNGAAYVLLMSQAVPAGLSTEEVGKLVEGWVDEAKAYGPEWTAETRARALKSLLGKKPYAGLATDMAQVADKELPSDASVEARSAMANQLARSARLAGRDAVAAEAEGRAMGYDAKLDAEYHEKVPPFKAAKYAGRPGGKGDRVVVMEIFTGAECPPCVAADVAFDGLLQTYQPSEVIGLQYHLHIPGPDPLTNVDSIARQGYYATEVRGTPSTFFNGKSQAGGGGGMGNSKGKYDQYRGLIDPDLAKEKRGEIALTATRTGDEVKVVAKAKLEGPPNEARPMLRLVLIEDSVRYAGSNKLRFHENVVRAFPGGVAGKAIGQGEESMMASVNLVDLRKAQDDYLASYPSSGGRARDFPQPLPPMKFDELSVVALIQDDADHAIWHAVQVPVKTGTP